MPNILRTYRFPLGLRALMFFGVCFFGYLAFITNTSSAEKGTPTALCFIPFMLACTVMFILTGYRVEVSEHSIATSWLGRKKSLRWNEIARLQSQVGGGLELHSSDADKLFVNTQVEGYLEIVDIIRYKRPDLWKVDNAKVFHQSRVLLLILGLPGLGLTLLGLKVFLDGSTFLGLALMAMIIGATGYVLLTQVQELTIAERELILRYLFWERRIRVEAVKTIVLSQEQSGYGTVGHAVLLKLGDGKEIGLNGFKEGNPILYSALETWWQKYRNLSE